MEKTRYEPTGGGNEILRGDGFFISYNAAPCVGLSFWSSDEGSPETALVVDGKYYILNGDFRNEYAAIVDEGRAACLKFFAGKPDLASSWSDKLDQIGAEDTRRAA